jgi:hypothetical protein
MHAGALYIEWQSLCHTSNGGSDFVNSRFMMSEEGVRRNPCPAHRQKATPMGESLSQDATEMRGAVIFVIHVDETVYSWVFKVRMAFSECQPWLLTTVGED